MAENSKIQSMQAIQQAISGSTPSPAKHSANQSKGLRSRPDQRQAAAQQASARYFDRLGVQTLFKALPESTQLELTKLEGADKQANFAAILHPQQGQALRSKLIEMAYKGEELPADASNPDTAQIYANLNQLANRPEFEPVRSAITTIQTAVANARSQWQQQQASEGAPSSALQQLVSQLRSTHPLPLSGAAGSQVDLPNARNKIEAYSKNQCDTFKEQAATLADILEDKIPGAKTISQKESNLVEQAISDHASAEKDYFANRNNQMMYLYISDRLAKMTYTPSWFFQRWGRRLANPLWGNRAVAFEQRIMPKAGDWTSELSKDKNFPTDPTHGLPGIRMMAKAVAPENTEIVHNGETEETDITHDRFYNGGPRYTFHNQERATGLRERGSKMNTFDINDSGNTLRFSWHTGKPNRGIQSNERFAVISRLLDVATLKYAKGEWGSIDISRISDVYAMKLPRWFKKWANDEGIAEDLRLESYKSGEKKSLTRREFAYLYARMNGVPHHAIKSGMAVSQHLFNIGEALAAKAMNELSQFGALPEEGHAKIADDNAATLELSEDQAAIADKAIPSADLDDPDKQEAAQSADDIPEAEAEFEAMHAEQFTNTKALSKLLHIEIYDSGILPQRAVQTSDDSNGLSMQPVEVLDRHQLVEVQKTIREQAEKGETAQALVNVRRYIHETAEAGNTENLGLALSRLTPATRAIVIELMTEEQAQTLYETMLPLAQRAIMVKNFSAREALREVYEFLLKPSTQASHITVADHAMKMVKTLQLTGHSQKAALLPPPVFANLWKANPPSSLKTLLTATLLNFSAKYIAMTISLLPSAQRSDELDIQKETVDSLKKTISAMPQGREKEQSAIKFNETLSLLRFSKGDLNEKANILTELPRPKPGVAKDLRKVLFDTLSNEEKQQVLNQLTSKESSTQLAKELQSHILQPEVSQTLQSQTDNIKQQANELAANLRPLIQANNYESIKDHVTPGGGLVAKAMNQLHADGTTPEKINQALRQVEPDDLRVITFGQLNGALQTALFNESSIAGEAEQPDLRAAALTQVFVNSNTVKARELAESIAEDEKRAEVITAIEVEKIRDELVAQLSAQPSSATSSPR